MITFHKFDTFSVPNIIKTKKQACLAKHMKIVINRWQLLEFDLNRGVGLNREGFAQRGGIIREGGLIALSR